MSTPARPSERRSTSLPRRRAPCGRRTVCSIARTRRGRSPRGHHAPLRARRDAPHVERADGRPGKLLDDTATVNALLDRSLCRRAADAACTTRENGAKDPDQRAVSPAGARLGAVRPQKSGYSRVVRGDSNGLLKTASSLELSASSAPGPVGLTTTGGFTGRPCSLRS